jgi:hypothetical protein
MASELSKSIQRSFREALKTGVQQSVGGAIQAAGQQVAAQGVSTQYQETMTAATDTLKTYWPYLALLGGALLIMKTVK